MVKFVLREIWAVRKCSNMHLQTHMLFTNASTCNCCVQCQIRLHFGWSFLGGHLDSKKQLFCNWGGQLQTGLTQKNNFSATGGVSCTFNFATDPPSCKIIVFLSLGSFFATDPPSCKIIVFLSNCNFNFHHVHPQLQNVFPSHASTLYNCISRINLLAGVWGVCLGVVIGRR
jgi:hypothetical protein